MQRFRFPVAVGLTSIALVLIAIGVAGLLVTNAVASSPVGAFVAGVPFGGPGGPWHAGGWNHAGLPPELAGLGDVPADQRFSHFRGARVQLTDKNNQPVTLDATPGTVTAASQSSLSIAANDGSSRTYAIDDKTTTRGKSAAQNDKVVVVTLNNSSTATAVMVLDGDGAPGPRGYWGR